MHASETWTWNSTKQSICATEMSYEGCMCANKVGWRVMSVSKAGAVIVRDQELSSVQWLNEKTCGRTLKWFGQG